ncbi:protein REVEILLE 7-like [Forsythia ovata]|uniref:Protein REVEILLE 7-like n=1 Tax=Forsythia ovata TaxID=205694 RepID=A0ABD1UA81_9LAMI
MEKTKGQSEGTGSDIILPTSKKNSLKINAPSIKSILLKEQLTPGGDFASKVVRESNIGDASSVKPIEIPPPRPKRKPVHPYPRKQGSPVKTVISAPKKPLSSVSPSLSVLELENQSPTSVLSAIGSDATTDSDMPNGCSSPVSSAAANSSEESKSSPGREYVRSSPDEQAPLKLELQYEDNAFVKEESAESAPQCLKLFGKTLLVTDSRGPSYPTQTCKMQDRIDGTCFQTLPWNLVLPSCSSSHSEGIWSGLSRRLPEPFHYTQSTDNQSNHVEACLDTVQWSSLRGYTTFSPLQVHNPIPIKARPSCDKNEQEKDDGKDCFSIGSNADIGSASRVGDKNGDVESQSSILYIEREGNEAGSLSSRLSEKARTNAMSCKKGFVPYKRCLAERDLTLSMITGEEREEQRIRLCL